MPLAFGNEARTAFSAGFGGKGGLGLPPTPPPHTHTPLPEERFPLDPPPRKPSRLLGGGGRQKGPGGGMRQADLFTQQGSFSGTPCSE